MKRRKQIIQTVLMSVIINGVIPVILYNIFLPYFTNITALLIATSVPLADNLIFILKYRKIDAFALFMLTGFVLSIVAFFIGGSEKLILLRESFVTGVLGLVFIVSLLFSKPLIYHFAIKFMAGNTNSNQQTFLDGWNQPYFRFVLRLMTAVWGLALVGEAIIRIILVYKLSVSSFLAFSQLTFYLILGITILWTVFYRKYAIKRLELIKK